MSFISAEEFGKIVANDPSRLMAYSYAYHRNQEIQSCVLAGLDPDTVAQIGPEMDPELCMEIALIALFDHLDIDQTAAQ